MLFKLKPEAGDDKIKEFEKMAKGMVGQIPGRYNTFITLIFARTKI